MTILNCSLTGSPAHRNIFLALFIDLVKHFTFIQQQKQIQATTTTIITTIMNSKFIIKIIAFLLSVAILQVCAQVPVSEQGEFSAEVSLVPIQFQITDDQIDFFTCLKNCNSALSAIGTINIQESSVSLFVPEQGNQATTCTIPEVSIEMTNIEKQSTGSNYNAQVSMTYDNTTISLGTRCFALNTEEVFQLELVDATNCPTATESVCTAISATNTTADSVVIVFKSTGLEPVASSVATSVIPSTSTVLPRESSEDSGAAPVISFQMMLVMAIAIVVLTIFSKVH
jgi:hypothetical protein